ncbi:molecular chaperone GrpE [Fontibacillus panacisegetis]|uniref:Protein GrpE n=2 Tax=Fontibacillus panacisegetis TaxID=670482 RepID=A0A1G7FT51_9BACL|nr:molecular chaperone GrpE [Fontibacillus panacisegetis]
MKKQSVQEDYMNTNQEEESTLNDNVNQDQSQQEEASFSAGETGQVNEDVVVSEDASSETGKLLAEVEEHKQRLLRTQADFDNFRRRTQKEKEELGKYASAKLITELLPVVDNFERALSTTSDTTEAASYAKGVEMILRQFEGILQAEGLTAMETVGQPFNPEYHQAIMQVESEDHEEGIIVEELQKGYLLKDKVLRPAMVKVSG